MADDKAEAFKEAAQRAIADYAEVNGVSLEQAAVEVRDMLTGEVEPLRVYRR